MAKAPLTDEPIVYQKLTPSTESTEERVARISEESAGIYNPVETFSPVTESEIEILVDEKIKEMPEQAKAVGLRRRNFEHPMMAKGLIPKRKK